MLPNQLQQLADAIRAALGVTWQEISGRDRSRCVQNARVIFAHHAAGQGWPNSRIERLLGRRNGAAQWYLTRYADFVTYDRRFRRAVDEVDNELCHRCKPKTRAEKIRQEMMDNPLPSPTPQRCEGCIHNIELPEGRFCIGVLYLCCMEAERLERLTNPKNEKL